MSSLSVLTNLSIIPSLFPPDICSSFDTLESNLILYFSQNCFTAALPNSLSPSSPLICPTSFLNSSNVFTVISPLFSFMLLGYTYAYAFLLSISTNNNIGSNDSPFSHQNMSI